MALTTTIAAPGSSSAASASFATPLEMLGECHRRVERQCATLARLVPHLAEHGSDRAAREAASAVLRYFDLAGPKHHADEEEDLFPALLESMAGSDAVCLRELTESLAADHREFERRWAAIRRTLQEVAAGRAARLEAAEVQGYADLYSRHIAREEGELLPMAARLLGDAEVERISLAMQRRRGLLPESLP
ncbi:MAG: hemerythrin domain-containing protein [Rubrivivax sp.]|nr:hemerythrin domain-containing protein [Rubrivivax sp.]